MAVLVIFLKLYLYLVLALFEIYDHKNKLVGLELAVQTCC